MTVTAESFLAGGMRPGGQPTVDAFIKANVKTCIFEMFSSFNAVRINSTWF